MPLYAQTSTFVLRENGVYIMKLIDIKSQLRTQYNAPQDSARTEPGFLWTFSDSDGATFGVSSGVLFGNAKSKITMLVGGMYPDSLKPHFNIAEFDLESLVGKEYELVITKTRSNNRDVNNLVGISQVGVKK